MQVIAHLLTPLIEWVVPILTIFIESIGPINVLILLAIVAWLLVALAVATVIIIARIELLKAISAYREWQARREAEAIRKKAECVADDLRITQDFVDVGMAPSLMYQKQSDDEGIISGMCRAFCLNGGVADVVEGPFHDIECSKPCNEHPECALAH